MFYEVYGEVCFMKCSEKYVLIKIMFENLLKLGLLRRFR